MPWFGRPAASIVIPIPPSVFDVERAPVDECEVEWPGVLAGCFHCNGAGILDHVDDTTIPCYSDSAARAV